MKFTLSARTALASSIALGAFVAPSLAAAQVAPREDAVSVPNAEDGDEFDDSSDTSSGNTIIVTATKREQTLQEIPVAVSVTGAETIENAAIRDLADLQTVVPSLRVNTLQSSANTNFIIRGFGNGANNAGIEPSVGVFVDGVYRSRTASQINDLPDVQRVEVLRGPQSTLFGKNASAGVISIVTREPQFNPEGSVELSYGNYNAIVAKGYVTGPVTDNVAVSVAGGINRRDGYLVDQGTGDVSNERDRWFVRGQALFEADNGDSFRVIADYDKIDEICCGVVNLQPSAATQIIRALGGDVNDANDPFDDVIFNNFNSTNEIENYGISGELNFDLGLADFTAITAYRESGTLTNQDSDFTSADLLGENALDLGIQTFTQELRMNAELGDFFSLLLGAYFFDENIQQENSLLFGDDFRQFANLQIQAGTGGALDIVGLERTVGALLGDPTQFDNQFFAAGTGQTGTSRLDNTAYSIFGQMDFEIAYGLTLTLGGNYTWDKKDFRIDFDSTDTFAAVDLIGVGNTAIAQQGIATTIGDALMLDRPATAAEIQAFAGGNPQAFAAIQAGAQAFADANDTNPAVNPLLSLRPLQFSTPFVDVPNVVENGETDDENFSWTARLAYDLTDDINVYASYATGFKASSVNLSRDSRPVLDDATALAQAGLVPNNLTFGSRFAGPEESKVYELGLKANFPTFSTNIAVFDQTIEGFQSNIFTGTGFALANAGEQSTFGVEFEATWTPIEAFVLSLGATYLDPQYDSFTNSAVGDLSGTRPAGIPEWTTLIAGQYTADIGSNELILRASYSHQSDTQIAEGLPGFIQRDAVGNVVSYQPAFDAAAQFTREVNQVDASITFATAAGFDLQVWGRNLLDDRYITTIFDSVAQPGSISGYTNQPRTYGAAVRYKF